MNSPMYSKRTLLSSPNLIKLLLSNTTMWLPLPLGSGMTMLQLLMRSPLHVENTVPLLNVIMWLAAIRSQRVAGIWLLSQQFTKIFWLSQSKDKVIVVDTQGIERVLLWPSHDTLDIILHSEHSFWKLPKQRCDTLFFIYTPSYQINKRQ